MNIIDIKYKKATFRGRIIGDDNIFITEYGFCWDINNNPTKENNYINLGETTQSGYYYYTVTDLSYNTNYYMRPYIRSDYSTNTEIIYGPNQHFKTLLPDKELINRIYESKSVVSLQTSGTTGQRKTIKHKIYPLQLGSINRKKK